MKILLLILLLLSTSFVFGQKTIDQLKSETKNFRNNKRFEIEYDKFKDKSAVSFSSFSVLSTERGGGIIYFGLSFSYDGETLKSSPEKYNLFFLSSGSVWRFLKNRNLIFLLDAERLPFGEGAHNGRIVSSRRSSGVSESVTFSITRKDLERLVNSKETEFQLGSFTGKLTDEHKQMLKDMLKLSAIN